MASSRLVLPDALAPLISVNWESRSRPTDCKQRKSVTCTRPSDNSEPHRHHDIACGGIARRANQATAIAIRQAELHFLPVDCRQGIKQIVHVEAHFEVAAVVAHLDFFLGFLL